MKNDQIHEIDALTLAFFESKLPEDRDALRRKLDEIAVIIGITSKQLKHVLERKRNLSTKNAEALAHYYHLSHFEMLRQGYKILHQIQDGLENRPPPVLKIQGVPHFQTFSETFAMESYIPIRILEGSAAAGHPREVNEEFIRGWALIFASKEWMPNDPEQYTCIHVSGSSMAPILQDGDIVAVDHVIKDPLILDKKMVVFRVNGGITIKWLKYFPDKALVIGVPENKDEFDTVITLKGEEINDGIVGKVAWWWAKR